MKQLSEQDALFALYIEKEEYEESWFTASVEAIWKWYSARSSYHRYNYEQTGDFRSTDKYQELKRQALDRLNKKLEQAWLDIQELLP